MIFISTTPIAYLSPFYLLTPFNQRFHVIVVSLIRYNETAFYSPNSPIRFMATVRLFVRSSVCVLDGVFTKSLCNVGSFINANSLTKCYL